MSPDELLILCAHDAADRTVAELPMADGQQHHLAVNVSDARAMFSLTGEAGALRDVLAKVTPADMAALEPRRDAPHAAATGARRDLVRKRDRGARGLLPLRGAYVFDLLALSAREGGAVGKHVDLPPLRPPSVLRQDTAT
jgi:sarcosine oxidase subunit gamma